MTSTDIQLLVLAVVLVFLAGLFVCAETALSSISRVRADELLREGRGGAQRLANVVADPPRFLNTTLLLGALFEITGVVLVTIVVVNRFESTWLQVLVAAGVMVVVSYIAVGVGPRTLGRQHPDRVALVSATPVSALTAVLGPIPQLLIFIGNVVTPGKGFREGPFASEAELRDLVDRAASSRVIESSESRMIHSVFELGDTLAREVMVPRTDMVFIEHHKTLRQLMSLALRSGFSRIPVLGRDLDDIIGVAYLKDVTKRVFDKHEAETTERVDTVMRQTLFVPDSKPADQLLRDMQAQRTHVAILVDEYGGTAGLVTIEDLLEEIVGEITDEYDREPAAVEHLSGGAVRVSSRLDVDELAELFDVQIDDEDVETVGGLMAKHLGRVPIPGAEVVCEGLHLQAESLAGRRNKVVTVVVTRVEEKATNAPRSSAEDAVSDVLGLTVMPFELTDPEDVKLLTLARASRTRANSVEGAAVRDSDGRTYSAAGVDLPSLQLSALQVAVAMAISSGVRGLESAVLVTEVLSIAPGDVDAVRDFAGLEVPVYRCDTSGAVIDAVMT